jgi:hypothetical protein
MPQILRLAVDFQAAGTTGPDRGRAGATALPQMWMGG